MSYGTDFTDLYRRAAVYVDKILKGAKPADLPVQQATKFEFIVNVRAAKQIGLTLSPEFLSRANKVVKKQNPKSEYRNSKQTQIEIHLKSGKPKTRKSREVCLQFAYLVIRNCFEFRCAGKNRQGVVNESFIR
jgi:hypothetical protein